MTSCLFVGGAALASWYLAATLYLVFHDRLLATLIARQTTTQYAYEDRIAGLSVQLDQETSRSLVDRHTLETTVRDLEERSSRLSARAALIEQLVGRKASPAAGSPATASRTLIPDRATALPSGARSYSGTDGAHGPGEVTYEVPPLRMDAGRRSDDDTPQQPAIAEKRANAEEYDLSTTTSAIASTLLTVEHKQERDLASLRDPALRTLAKMRTALAAVGVPHGQVDASGRARDVGGPFVPLPAGALTFEQNAALLQDALLQTDRLAALIDKVPLRQPLPGSLEVTSTFGPRLDPFLGRPAMHTGIDFRENAGTPVHATAAGTITIAAAEGGYGTMVEVNHGNGLSTRYAHLSSASVSPGQRIEAGAVVGRVGSTGRATGPHLHYETRINGEPVDPTRFLTTGARLFEP